MKSERKIFAVSDENLIRKRDDDDDMAVGGGGVK